MLKKNSKKINLGLKSQVSIRKPAPHSKRLNSNMLRARPKLPSPTNPQMPWFFVVLCGVVLCRGLSEVTAHVYNHLRSECQVQNN